MIAQWENECISLSVLSVAQVMIAQWENECISVSVLSVAGVMIAQWENECISLLILSVAQIHGSSVGERMYLPICPPHSPGSIPRPWQSISRDFLPVITLCKPILSHRG